VQLTVHGIAALCSICQLLPCICQLLSCFLQLLLEGRCI
jgi:hypothetical protein